VNNEPHFCLLVLFPETYVHFEIFSYDLLHTCVLFQWMVRHGAIAETNNAYSPIHLPNFS